MPYPTAVRSRSHHSRQLPRWKCLPYGFTLLLSILLFLPPAAAQSQETEKDKTIAPATILSDSTISLKDIRQGPRSALIWSAIPGGGQAYNKKYWKVPLVYSGLLGMIAFADFNQTRYTRFIGALENRCLGEGNKIIPPNNACIPTVDEFPVDRISNDALIQARDNADRSRQTAYIGIFVVYVLQAVEAYTDAHLQEFDISDDLSLRVGPVSQPEYGLGYGMTVPIGRNKRFRREVHKARQLEFGR